MTCQIPLSRRSRGGSRRSGGDLLLAGLAVFAIVLSGCGEEPPPPPKPVAKAAPPPPPPPPTVAEIADELQIDTMVIRLSEEDAPDATDQRYAVLEFFDGWYRGDSDTVFDMLSPADGRELRSMVEDGQWESSTSDIDAIFISTGLSPAGDQCVLAVYEVGVTSQPQLWQMQGRGDDIIFEAVSTPPEMMSRLSGDMVSGWFEILNQEKELWTVPDTQLSLLEEEEEDTGAARPSGPAAGGGRRPGGGRRGPGG